MVAVPKRHSPASECLELWNRWTAAVSAAVDRGHAHRRLTAEKYHTLHSQLLEACRRAADADPDNSIYHRIETLAAPWIALEVFSHTDRHMLRVLLQQCDEISAIIGGRRRKRTQHARLLSLSAAVLAFLGMLYLAGYDDFNSVWLEGRRIYRRFEFSLASSDFLSTFSVFAIVAIAAGMWFANSVRKS